MITLNDDYTLSLETPNLKIKILNYSQITNAHSCQDGTYIAYSFL